MREDHITFESGSATLAGTFAFPDREDPDRTAAMPTALLIAGSGPLDRDGNHKKMALGISRDLASDLADNGWASLRFDKRGVGESGGDYLSTGFYDELADIEAALAWLQQRDDVSNIVLIGHSAGAVQAGKLASRYPTLAGAVMLSTSAKTGEETLRWQAKEMQDVIVPAPVKLLLKLFRTSVLKQQAKAIAKLKATTTDVARIQLVKVNAKWMREYIAHDPLPAIRTAQVPLLAITGSKDVQVDAGDIATILAEAPKGTEAYAIPDVDHILRHEPGAISNPRKYKNQLKKPIDRRIIGAAADWLQALPCSPAAPQPGH